MKVASEITNFEIFNFNINNSNFDNKENKLIKPDDQAISSNKIPNASVLNKLNTNNNYIKEHESNSVYSKKSFQLIKQINEDLSNIDINIPLKKSRKSSQSNFKTVANAKLNYANSPNNNKNKNIDNNYLLSNEDFNPNSNNNKDYKINEIKNPKISTKYYDSRNNPFDDNLFINKNYKEDPRNKDYRGKV